MSFSSDVKDSLSLVDFKKNCCGESYKKGFSLTEFEPVCDHCKGAYLRGVFMKCGFVSKPTKNFMLSLSTKTEEYTEYIKSMLGEIGLEPKRSVRKGMPLLYYKESEKIEDFLSYIGGTKAALSIISEKVMCDVRNNTNRICNAETANIDRAATAAAEQNRAINFIREKGALSKLSPELRECAELRMKYPDVSLDDLRMMFRDPVSKSGLYHRLRKLMDIALVLRNGG